MRCFCNYVPWFLRSSSMANFSATRVFPRSPVLYYWVMMTCNELILATLLQGFFDSSAVLLRGNVEKMEALVNLYLILLCFDEIVDEGMILEVDAGFISGKVASHCIDSATPLSEQTISQAFATAREHLTRSLLK